MPPKSPAILCRFTRTTFTRTTLLTTLLTTRCTTSLTAFLTTT